jgi:hypothetical protein
LKGTEPQNRFKLESLEQRILLSVDSPLGAEQMGVPDEWESIFDADLNVPPL